VLLNNYVSFEELAQLKEIEDAVERFYNSGKFQKTIEYMAFRLFKTPFDFFRELGRYFTLNTIRGNAISARECLKILAGIVKDFFYDQSSLIFDLMRFDYLSSSSERNIPDVLFQEWSSSQRHDKSELAVKNKDFFRTKKYYEAFDHDITFPVIQPDIPLSRTIVSFDYSQRDSVSGLYRYEKISL
jgi:hypothetical protein